MRSLKQALKHNEHSPENNIKYSQSYIFLNIACNETWTGAITRDLADGMRWRVCAAGLSSPRRSAPVSERRLEHEGGAHGCIR